MILRTFQPAARAEALLAGHTLVGGWKHAPPEPVRAGYRGMVAAMAKAGVDTGGRPPIWAWHGQLQLLDAVMLLGDPQRCAGHVTIEFEAPDVLVVLTEYGAWNDHLCALVDGIHVDGWTAVPPATSPAQACLPHLERGWVRAVRPLPASGWSDLDWTVEV